MRGPFQVRLPRPRWGLLLRNIALGARECGNGLAVAHGIRDTDKLVQGGPEVDVGTMLSRRRLTSTDVEAKRRGIDVRTLDVDSSNTNSAPYWERCAPTFLQESQQGRRMTVPGEQPICDFAGLWRTIATLRLQHQTGGAILWQSAAKERIKQDGNAHGRGMVLGLFRASIRA
ncbi:hypothetical protein PF004_g26347 [Phytophthora fragariae]|uniref:Uncharacterized protein n=1 Tax=Phytophthora fragariae TaxID=53985 RepID=A0A6G0MQG2_9STRA|nr:hypothetical protein PF004_g26347 [Phytophthora fragariae]